MNRILLEPRQLPRHACQIYDRVKQHKGDSSRKDLPPMRKSGLTKSIGCKKYLIYHEVCYSVARSIFPLLGRCQDQRRKLQER